eukprot:scaffold70_cov242-Pinguiococcus_pyrenoidosus.AAC.5
MCSRVATCDFACLRTGALEPLLLPRRQIVPKRPREDVVFCFTPKPEVNQPIQASPYLVRLAAGSLPVCRWLGTAVKKVAFTPKDGRGRVDRYARCTRERRRAWRLGAVRSGVLDSRLFAVCRCSPRLFWLMRSSCFTPDALFSFSAALLASSSEIRRSNSTSLSRESITVERVPTVSG